MADKKAWAEIVITEQKGVGVLCERTACKWPMQLKDAQALIDGKAVIVDLEKLEEIEEAIHNITSWCKAYPIAIFPEPDFKKAAKVLKKHGMTVDAISASAGRHVLNGVASYATQAELRLNTLIQGGE